MSHCTRIIRDLALIMKSCKLWFILNMMGGRKAWFFLPKTFLAKSDWCVVTTVTIFSPTQRARLSGPPRYLERVRKAYRKFSRGTWKKVSAQKHEVLSEYSNLILSFISSTSQNCFHFSCHIIRFLCLMITIYFTGANIKVRRTFQIPWTCS